MKTEKEIIEEIYFSKDVYSIKIAIAEGVKAGREIGRAEGRKELAKEIIEYIEREKYRSDYTHYMQGYNAALEQLKIDKLNQEVHHV